MAITSWVRILASIGMIVFAGAITVGATGAFFSDAETSTGNTFTAGAIDLQIDNESYVTNNAGVLVASPNNTWGLSDLTDQLFFSFTDLKPGDIGEDTISIHAGSNDAWACMAVDINGTPENALVGPETDAGDQGEPGELQNYLNFAFWADDGDNVLESNETVLWNGLASALFNGIWKPIADASDSGFFGDTPLAGNQTVHIAKAWCFGNLEPAPQSPGDLNPLMNTGFTCDGSGNQNNAQTDGITADVSFYAEQARNNPDFECAALDPFEAGPASIVSAGPTEVSDGFTPQIGSTIDQDVDAYIGRTTTYTGPQIGLGDPETIKWKVTVDGPSALTADMVDLDEVGWEDQTDQNIETFHYPFGAVGGNLVAVGSCDGNVGAVGHSNSCATLIGFSLVENDVFTNADKINFGITAPTGTYTIKYELVNTNGGAVLGTHTVTVEVI